MKPRSRERYRVAIGQSLESYLVVRQRKLGCCRRLPLSNSMITKSCSGAAPQKGRNPGVGDAGPEPRVSTAIAISTYSKRFGGQNGMQNFGNAIDDIDAGPAPAKPDPCFIPTVSAPRLRLRTSAEGRGSRVGGDSVSLPAATRPCLLKSQLGRTFEGIQ
ncbi:hypothetical protein NA56DRAFT_696689 [Hyaloscypha hepaticicola]|uniref:Uncharacterized protein n=1 Tax=Hyaloscypha hepaticicola TaxID=2082293 RepID=A0A2J6QN29_9HELO|nr:hypothetical protein NA56DRAFT_696689 [Hyaloscypha hepaticicola]